MNGFPAQVALISLFELIGGIAVGAGLRRLGRGLSPNLIFFFVWGGMFSCIPLAAGLQEFSDTGQFGLLAVQLGVLLIAVLAAALTPNSILDSLRSPQVSPIAGGGLFVLVGIGVGVLVWQSAPLYALGFGGCFAGAGALLFISGLKKLMKS